MKQLIGIFLLLLTIPAHAKLTLQEVREALTQRGSTWEAGETKVSDLSGAEVQRRLGAILPEGHGDFFEMEESSRGSKKLPPRWDWRSREGVQMVSPILDQGRCGSCVAFAAIYMLETQMNVTQNTPASPWGFSPQHLFSCGGGACERGWQLHSAARFMKNDGVPDEACFPYQSGALGEDTSCSSSCSDASSRVEKIVRYSQPTVFLMSVDKIKEALQRGPVMTAFSVYEDFLYYKSGVYKHVTGPVVGGHAVTIVGYDDADKAWIVANSWGPDWGENGYFRISWSSAGGFGSSTYQVEVAPREGMVTAGKARDGVTLRGVVDLRPTSTFDGTTQIGWTLTKLGSREPVAWGAAIDLLDTTVHSDGVYEIQAEAHHAAGISKSQPKRVYILNGALKGLIRVTSHQDGDKVKGSVKLLLDVESYPIPFSKITFTATHVPTGETHVRGTTNVGPKMKLSWRTDKLPKGEYQIRITGSASHFAQVSSQPFNLKVE